MVPEDTCCNNLYTQVCLLQNSALAEWLKQALNLKHGCGLHCFLLAIHMQIILPGSLLFGVSAKITNEKRKYCTLLAFKKDIFYYQHLSQLFWRFMHLKSSNDELMNFFASYLPLGIVWDSFLVLVSAITWSLGHFHNL